MKRKHILFIILSVVLLIFIAAAAFIMNFISEAKDYTSVLAVHKAVAGNPDNHPQSTPLPGNSPVSQVDPKGEGNSEAPGSSQDTTGMAESNIIHILFLGIDRTEERDATLGVYRPDTIALLTINLNTKEVTVLNIPRDTYAYIPVIKKNDKINHSYVWGGMGKKGIASTIDTVERFIKYAKVDYYFAIDMEPVPEIVDAVGGVEVDVEIDMKDHGANLSKGRQVLNGSKAFDYIHWRYSGMGDIDRIKRQQKFVKALISKLKDSGQIGEAVKLVMNYDKYIQTNMSLKQMLAMANMAEDIPKSSDRFYTVPGNPQTMKNISYWIADEEATDKLLREVLLQPDMH